MGKSLVWLAAELSLLAAAPAVARGGDEYACDYCEQFPYSRFRFQIEGGPTITQGYGARYLDNGTNVGLGVTWQPTPKRPFALRADAMYQSFAARQLLLEQASANFGTHIDEGSVHMWGADLDAEFDLKLNTWTRLYFLAGGGWYNQQNNFRQNGVLVERNTTGTRFAKNAGLGVEFANGGDVFFFIDVRYMRFSVNGQHVDFVPIRLGIRF